MTLVLASARSDIAGYLSTLLYVYTIIILIYILSQWAFAMGLRPGYSRTFDIIQGFLRDVCDPYLRIFRRILPMFGPLDLSPIVAIIVLQLVNSIVVVQIIGG